MATKVLMALGLLALLLLLSGFAPTLEERVQTLERTIEACCSQEYATVDEDRLRDFVALKRRLAELELRVKVLEEAKP